MEGTEKSSLSKRGAYLLFVKVNARCRIKIGSLGDVDFEPGIYVYVGSAMGGFKRRILRYFRPIRNKKWHIDYLLEVGDVEGVLLIPSEGKIESLLVSALESIERLEPFAPGFGASDTKDKTHLFRFKW